MTTETTTVADEIAAMRSLTALRRLTTCRCEPAWTDRDRHAPDCVAEYRDDVEALANQLDAMRPVVEAARQWRAQFSRPADTRFPPRIGALIAAVDALDGAS